MAKGLSDLDVFLIKEKSFSLINKGFHVYNYDEEPVLFVDMPSFGLKKQLNFYTDELKTERIFWIKQDKIVHLTHATYTLYLGEEQILARFGAELLENIIKRDIKISKPNGELLCHLREESAVGGLLGKLSGANFVFRNGEEVLGRFQTHPKEKGKSKLDLTVEVGPKLDYIVALTAAIILYARLI